MERIETVLFFHGIAMTTASSNNQVQTSIAQSWFDLDEGSRPCGYFGTWDPIDYGIDSGNGCCNSIAHLFFLSFINIVPLQIRFECKSTPSPSFLLRNTERKKKQNKCRTRNHHLNGRIKQPIDWLSTGRENGRRRRHCRRRRRVQWHPSNQQIAPPSTKPNNNKKENKKRKRTTHTHTQHKGGVGD